MRALAGYYTDQELESILGAKLARQAREDARRLFADKEWRERIYANLRDVFDITIEQLREELFELRRRRARRERQSPRRRAGRRRS